MLDANTGVARLLERPDMLEGVQQRTQGRHSAPTLAFRIDDALAWFTDTAYEYDSVTFASGRSLVAHEAWFESASPRNPEIHSSAADAGRVAQGAEAERLLLIHLPPFQASLDGLLRDAHDQFEHAALAHDYTEISMATT